MFYYPGALHMHTLFSDGSGTVAEVIAAAGKAGLRWIIITDHDTLAGQQFEGWHANVLALIDYEITPDRNHFLALNVDTVIDHALAPQQYIDQVYANGGFGIIAHPDERVKHRFKDIYRWEDWSVDGPSERANKPVGIELWNVMSDWGEHVTLPNLPLLLAAPRLGLTAPTPETLAWWDRLNMHGRRTFGVGGVDAHAFKRKLLGATLTVLPYEWIFGTLTNYLLLHEPLAADAEQAKHQVYGALAEGRLYFVNRLDGDCPELAFFAERAGERHEIGATVALAGQPLTIHADVGCDADVQLIWNGRVLARGLKALRQTVVEPGIYRLEAYRRGRAWLYTNPLFVVA